MRISRILLVCILTLGILGISNVSSWSLEQAAPMKQSMKYVEAEDRCLGLLNTDSGAVMAMRPALTTNTIARQTAMGLMLGVRYAVGPREGLKHKASGVDSDQAQAVARYRHCRSQQTLESFASN